MEERSDLAALEIARRLASQASRPSPAAVQRLGGGRNNRVYRVDADGAPPLTLKLYHSDPRDLRDRLGAEWAFLVHARRQGLTSTPEPLAVDVAAKAALYSFAPGRKLSAGEIEPRHVDAALAFIQGLNRDPDATRGLSEGSEACFSLAGHVAMIARRVDRLASLDPDAPGRDKAEAFVWDVLRPRWEEVRREVEEGAARLGLGLDAPLAESAVIASPSDFGFHNALVDGETITFIDFEYAGRDDPAKLACDFFSCPEAPPPLAEFERFVGGLVAGADAARCRLLLDAYRIKWTCIVLNDFVAVGADRRAFADLGRTPERCAAQLARAQRLVDLLGTHA